MRVGLRVEGKHAFNVMKDMGLSNCRDLEGSDVSKYYFFDVDNQRIDFDTRFPHKENDVYAHSIKEFQELIGFQGKEANPETYPKASTETYPKVMEVSDNKRVWHRRVVFMEKNGKFLTWNNAENMEDAKETIHTSFWSYAREAQKTITIEELFKLANLDSSEYRLEE